MYKLNYFLVGGEILHKDNGLSDTVAVAIWVA